MTEQQELFAEKIVDTMLKNNVTLYMLDDDLDGLEDETAKKELLELLGENKYLDSDARKEDRNCIVTTTYFFSKHNLYLQEVQTGMCHYRDVAIDGGSDSTDYFICKEVSAVTYEIVKKL